jgi:predicted  nucleic acid-binding Zn-ribbon protein
MRFPATLLALLLGGGLVASEPPEVPAVRFDLLPGGRVNVVADNRSVPMEAARAEELRKALDALDLPGVRKDVAKLRELLRAADKARAEAETKAKSAEREAGRVRAAEADVASLEKRRASLEEQIQRAQRSKSDTVDSLRSQLAGVNQGLTKERKDLARAQERLANARKAKDEAEGLAKSAAAEAGRLRKSAEERLGKVREALRAAGLA